MYCLSLFVLKVMLLKQLLTVSYDGNTSKHVFNLQEIKKKTNMYQLTFLEGCINHNKPPKSFIKTTN